MTLWLVYRKDLARDTVVVRGIQEQVRQCPNCGWTDRTPDIGTRKGELQADSPSEQAQHLEEYLRGRLSVLVFPCLL
jgi:hypothetical protein